MVASNSTSAHGASSVSVAPLPPLPAWYQDYQHVFRSGAAHGFLLYGDVHGVTTIQSMTQLRFLQRMLQQAGRDIVLTYHRATGITFPTASMRRRALELLNPDWQTPTVSSSGHVPDALTMALAASGVVPAASDAGAAQDDELIPDPFRALRTPLEALPIIEELLRAPQGQGRVAVLIDGADLICPPTSKAVMSEDRLDVLARLCYWGTDSRLSRQNNPIFLLSSRLTDLHPDLRANDTGYKVLDLVLPDEATRLVYLRWYLQEHRADHPIPLLDLTLEDLARNTAGLNLRQIEDILLSGALHTPESGHAHGVTRELVKLRKDAMIRQQYSAIAVMLDPLPDGFAGLGGMDHLIALTREEVIQPMREGRRRDVPKGILLVGPPGTGKTRYVQAAAKELGFSAIALQMASILGGIVGESEQNLQQIFTFARSLAPTFLFLDEIDQSLLAQRGNTSGNPAAANLFGALLQFLGDETLRGHVIVVCATNHPELLDTALLRAGRMDMILPVLCPNEAARRSMAQVQARSQGVSIAPDALTLLARRTERYSAADLESLVKEARYLATSEHSTIIQVADVQSALDAIRPVTLAQVETYTRRALEACNNLRYLPPEYAAQARHRLASQAQMQASARQEREDGTHDVRRTRG